MILFHAQPYNIAATGFYFKTAEEYAQRAHGLTDDYGQPVEEFELQFIDGEPLDCDFAKAWQVNQAYLGAYLRAVDEWDDDEKIRFIIAVGECGYMFDAETVSPDDFDVDLHLEVTLRELAIEFVEEGYYGEIPKALEFYIDYDAIARDLAADYSEAQIGGRCLIYRCG